MTHAFVKKHALVFSKGVTCFDIYETFCTAHFCFSFACEFCAFCFNRFVNDCTVRYLGGCFCVRRFKIARDYSVHPNSARIDRRINRRESRAAGALMQAVTRNALASPSIFGINAGASLAVVCLTVMFPALAPPQTAMGAAFAGGALTADRVRGCLSIQRT